MPSKAATNARTPAPAAPPSSRRTAAGTRGALRSKQITKADAASILGVSTSMVRVLVKQGELNGELVDNVRYFDRSEVVALAAKRSANPKHGRRGAAASSSPSTRTAGELAAEGFRFLKEGRSPVDLVLEMHVTPEWAEDLVGRYNALRSLEVARVDAGEKCATCRQNAARFCGGCASVRKAAPPSTPGPASSA